MFDRRLVTDVALAAAIVFPAALPPTATPRNTDSHLVRPVAPPVLAQTSGGLDWPAQRNS